MRLIKRQVNKTLIVFWVLSFFALTFTVTAKEYPKVNGKYEFNIPAQPLNQSLNTLSDIAKISFLFPYDLVENKKGNSVQGHYNVQQALNLLLQGSNLEGELSNRKAFLIKPLTIKEANNNSFGKEKMKTQKTILATIFAALFTTTAVANAEEVQTDTVDETEVITVTGKYAKSLEKAMDIKRMSSNVVEAISAEDIGQLPDVTIADSLARLPGLFATKDRGNDSQISARGMGPRLTMSTLNGRELATAEPDRIVRFEQFPSELISGAQVYKSQSADLHEGGVAATINLETLNPLDYDERQLSIKAAFLNYQQASERPNSEENGFRVSGSYVDQFLEDTLGFTVGYSYQDQPSTLKHHDNWGWNDGSWQDDSPPDANGDGKLDYMPWGNGPAFISGSAERQSVMSKLQWQASDNLQFKLDAYYTDWKIDEKEENSWNCCWDNWGNWQADAGALSDVVVIEDHVMAATISQGVGVTQAQGNWNQNNDMLALGFNTKWNPTEDWSIDADISYSEATRSNAWHGLTYDYSGSESLTVHYDFRPERPDVSYPVGESALLDANNYTMGGLIVDNDGELTDEIISAKLDFTRALDLGLLSAVKFGVRYTDREKYNLALNWKQDAVLSEIPDNLQRGGYLMDGVPLVQLDYDATLATMYGGSEPSKANGKVGINEWRVTEETVSVWAMLDFEGGDEFMYSGNFGVRYIDTKQSSYGEQVINGAAENIVDGLSYTEVLPSFNVTLELTEDQLVRFGAARTLSRAPLDELRANRVLNVDVNENVPISGSGGNPKLAPFIANQLDLSYEWYFDEQSIAAISLFYKDVESYIGISVDTTPIDGRSANITSSINGEGGYIRGAELNYQAPFAFLPGFLSDFGLNVNYAYVQSDIEEVAPVDDPLSMNGLAEHNAAATLWYFKNGFEARLAYSYKSEFTEQVNWSVSSLQTNKSADYLDLSLSYDISEDLQVKADFANLQNTPVVTYTNNNPLSLGRFRETGRRFSIGANYKF